MSKVEEKQPTRRSVRRVAERLWRIGAIPCKSIRQTHCTIQTIAIFWVSISDQKANLSFCNHSVQCFPCISRLKSIADHENHPQFLWKSLMFYPYGAHDHCTLWIERMTQASLNKSPAVSNIGCLQDTLGFYR